MPPDFSSNALVVDDNPITRRIVADFLEDEGYAVRSFNLPEDIDCDPSTFGLVVMDVRFRRYLPDRVETARFGGIDYIIEQIQKGSIDPAKTMVIFMTRWSRDVPGIPERLEKVGAFEWIDISTGLELTDLAGLLRGKPRAHRSA